MAESKTVNLNAIELKRYAEEISQETLISPIVAEMVLEKYKDILIEQIVNEGAANILGLVKIKSKVTTSTFKTNPRDPNSEYVTKPMNRFSAHLSPFLKALIRLQARRFEDKPGLVNRDTWRGGLKWVHSDYALSNKNKKKTPDPTEIINPLLEDDD